VAVAATTDTAMQIAAVAA
ncbi:hypothetical protein A2U01_0098981, partial [Trifolium medium]|nr:hypothetical protein [Trifolium medium]